MHFKLLVAFLIIGASILQISSAQIDIGETSRGIIDDLIEKAKNAIKKLTQWVKDKVNSVLNYFENMHDKVTNLADEAVDSFEIKLNKIIDDATEKVNEFKKQADEIGVDISDCVAVSQEQFKDMFDYFVKNETQCVQDEVDRADVIIDEGTKILDDSLNAALALPGKVTDCRKGFKCILKVIWETAKLEATLPGKIAKKVKQVTVFVGGVPLRLKICASTQLVNAGFDSTSIVADVGFCLAGVE